MREADELELGRSVALALSIENTGGWLYTGEAEAERLRQKLWSLGEKPARDCHIPGCTRHWTERRGTMSQL
jgi:hypothetical protein